MSIVFRVHSFCHSFCAPTLISIEFFMEIILHCYCWVHLHFIRKDLARFFRSSRWKHDKKKCEADNRRKRWDKKRRKYKGFVHILSAYDCGEHPLLFELFRSMEPMQSMLARKTWRGVCVCVRDVFSKSSKWGQSIVRTPHTSNENADNDTDERQRRRRRRGMTLCQLFTSITHLPRFWYHLLGQFNAT